MGHILPNDSRSYKEDHKTEILSYRTFKLANKPIYLVRKKNVIKNIYYS